MKKLSYHEMVSQVANLLKKEKEKGRVLLVYVEGLSNSGKSTLINSLEKELENCIAIEGDLFHYGRDKTTLIYSDCLEKIRNGEKPDYDHGLLSTLWNFQKMENELVEPIKEFNKDASAKKIITLTNILEDKISNTEHDRTYEINKDSIILVSGMYLRQIKGFDYIIYLNINSDSSINRKIERGKVLGLNRDPQTTHDMVKLVELPMMEKHNKMYPITKGVIIDLDDFDNISLEPINK